VASAAIARLEPGDVILKLNGAAVANLAQLRAGLDPLPAGQVVVLQVGRRGQLRFVAVTLE
jgi:S1-C subfamily serine protease